MWFSETLSPSLISDPNVEGKEGFLYELEALVAVRGVLDLCGQLRHTGLVLFLDNDPALRPLVKSSSSSPLLQSLFDELNQLEIAIDLNTWFGRAPSASNPADVPSKLLGSSFILWWWVACRS